MRIRVLAQFVAIIIIMTVLYVTRPALKLLMPGGEKFNAVDAEEARRTQRQRARSAQTSFDVMSEAARFARAIPSRPLRILCVLCVKIGFFSAPLCH